MQAAGIILSLALCTATMTAGSTAGSSQRIQVDSHLHLWTPDAERFPADPLPPPHLNVGGLATHENFVKLMDEAGICMAVVVQPVNYGQDYSYVMEAMSRHPSRLRGMFVADVAGLDALEAGERLRRTAGSHSGFVGVRFNPYKWPQDSEKGMADDVGVEMFKAAGDLGLVVGFMPFKGLRQHAKEVRALLEASPKTRVIIDHWGFFLQPAIGHGDDRSFDDESWTCLLELAAFPQVHVKISAPFRVAKEQWPYASLSDRLRQLIATSGSERLLWGSDFPYAAAPVEASEFVEYSKVVSAVDQWPIWSELSEKEKSDILHGTSVRLFNLKGVACDANKTRDDL